MGTDFRPRTIQTLVQNVRNPIDGIRAMRTGAGMVYALSRDAADYTGEGLGVVDSDGVTFDAGTEVLGVDYELSLLDIVTGHAAAAEGSGIEYSVRHADTPAEALGEGVVVVDTTSTASANTLRDLNASPATGDGSNLVFTCDAFVAADYEEAAPYVYVDSVLQTGGGTDYSWDGDQVAFVVGSVPGNGLSVVIGAMALGTPVITASRPPYAGKSAGRPNSSAGETVAVVWENTPDEDLTLTTDYTFDTETGVITLTAAGIDKLADGETYRVEYRYDNDYWKLTKDIDTQVGASVPCVLSVEVDGTPKTVTTHYTVEAGVGVTFTAGNIPAAAEVVELLHTWNNDKWLLTGPPTVQAGSSTVGTFSVEVDGTEKTGGGTHYTLDPGVSIIFAPGSIPAAGEVIEAISTQSMDVFTMTETAPASTDYSDPVLVVKIDSSEQELATDYTIAEDGVTVTFEAASIPTVAEAVTLLWRLSNNVFPIGETVGTGETVGVWHEGVKKTLTTDYTIVGTDVVFNSDKIPTEGQDVIINLFTAGATVIAGGEVWFDVLQKNTPVWDDIIPTSNAVVEVM